MKYSVGEQVIIRPVSDEKMEEWLADNSFDDEVNEARRRNVELRNLPGGQMISNIAATERNSYKYNPENTAMNYMVTNYHHQNVIPWRQICMAEINIFPMSEKKQLKLEVVV